MAYLLTEASQIKDLPLDKQTIRTLSEEMDAGQEVLPIVTDERAFVVKLCIQDDRSKCLEECRRKGYMLSRALSAAKIQKVAVDALFKGNEDRVEAFSEGLVLASYRFTRYKTTNKESLVNDFKFAERWKFTKELEQTAKAVFFARDLVNEPHSFLTAVQLAKSVAKAGKDFGFSSEILDKKKIESLKMGGLLSVNAGSIDPPSFSILEWKPKKAKNKKPIVLVGKGVVFDTGGLSLKPTPNSMDLMKSDMGGAACVAGTMAAIAGNELPLHVIGLIPATDNRPGQRATCPSDVIHMHDGSTVEVLNTDAEGRMILADALSFAKQYKPELVMDFATLTGAAVRAVGQRAVCYMSAAGKDINEQVEESGMEVFERLVEFPLWEDYGEQLKSEVADLKNIGGPTAGAITAGKFLQHFTDYPWMHFDIAGPAFLTTEDGYRGRGGSGVGVRLMYNFLKNYK